MPGTASQLLWLQKLDNGEAALMMGDARRPNEAPYAATRFKGPVADLKLARLSGGDVAFAVSGQSDPDGTLYNPETATKPLSSARVYSKNFVRHWDRYVTEERNALFFGVLQNGSSGAEKEPDRWAMKADSFVSVLANTKYECPVPAFGGAGDFDLSPVGMVFCTKAPAVDPSANTRMEIRFVAIEQLRSKTSLSYTQLDKHISLDGAASSPRISPDGSKVAFLKMRRNGYESDKNIPVVVQLDAEHSYRFGRCQPVDFNRSPSSLTWLPDNDRIILEAEDDGATKLFLWRTSQRSLGNVNLPSLNSMMPGSVSGISIRWQPLAGSPDRLDPEIHLLISTSSTTDSSAYWILDATLDLKSIAWGQLNSSSHNGASFALDSKQFSRIQIPSPDNVIRHVPALIMRPSTYDPAIKYPFALLIHGGPQGAWTDSWSTRWNPAIFAEAGYIVMCPNITGSTSYGQPYTDAIGGNWGGQPYEDVVACFEYAREQMADVDTTRAVALGASYGGYMVNYIQGMPLGRAFKALVTHDGVFSTQDQYTSEELYFPEHDFGGTPWDNPDGYRRWDPASPERLREWATPHLVVHNDLDYRLPVGQGIAAFNVLQRRGVESRFLGFPDEGHWVLKEENSLVWHREVLGWINRFVGLDQPDI